MPQSEARALDIALADIALADIALADIALADIDLADSRNYVDGVPHQWFTFLRRNAPVWWH
ncbi:MAG: hypothetical protein ACYCV7_12385, partial [Acidimicrobiales bacterium]